MQKWLDPERRQILERLHILPLPLLKIITEYAFIDISNTHIQLGRYPSIWYDVDTSYCDGCEVGHQPTLFSPSLYRTLWEQIDFAKLTQLETHTRELPQHNYHGHPLEVSDIYFVFGSEIYVLCSNLVHRPYYYGKWHREIERMYVFRFNITEIIEDFDPSVDFESHYLNPFLLGQEICIYDHSPQGFDELSYQRDPIYSGPWLPDDLTYDYEIWETSWLQDTSLPTDELDAICFVLLLHQSNMVNSGK
jgi:hypothetical protein